MNEIVKRAMLELFKTSYFKQPEPEPEPEEQSIPALELEEVLEQGQGEGEEEKKKPKKQQKKKAQIFPPAFKQCFVVFIDESELPGFGVNLFLTLHHTRFSKANFCDSFVYVA